MTAGAYEFYLPVFKLSLMSVRGERVRDITNSR